MWDCDWGLWLGIGMGLGIGIGNQELGLRIGIGDRVLSGGKSLRKPNCSSFSAWEQLEIALNRVDLSNVCLLIGVIVAKQISSLNQSSVQARNWIRSSVQD